MSTPGRPGNPRPVDALTAGGGGYFCSGSSPRRYGGNETHSRSPPFAATQPRASEASDGESEPGRPASPPPPPPPEPWEGEGTDSPDVLEQLLSGGASTAVRHPALQPRPQGQRQKQRQGQRQGQQQGQQQQPWHARDPPRVRLGYIWWMLSSLTQRLESIQRELKVELAFKIAELKRLTGQAERLMSENPDGGELWHDLYQSRGTLVERINRLVAGDLLLRTCLDHETEELWTQVAVGVGDEIIEAWCSLVAEWRQEYP